MISRPKLISHKFMKDVSVQLQKKNRIIFRKIEK